MKIIIAADHGGFKPKQELVGFLRARGHRVVDAGTNSEDSVDYPDFARIVGQAVGRKKCDRGVLICGTGIGMAMAANKIDGVRAAVAWNPQTARLAAEHNKANVLCLSGRLFKTSDLIKM